MMLQFLDQLMLGSGKHMQDEVNNVLAQLGYKDLDEIYSDSDASDHRQEETEIALDNSIQNQIYGLFQKDDKAGKEAFSRHQENSKTSKDRQKQLAQNLQQLLEEK